MKTICFLAASLLTVVAANAAEPVRIGITTILSGPIADRGQSEQYGAQLALDSINQSGGVLGRPVEAFYADNACKPDVGVVETRRLIEQEHVPVIIGALCTPVTHAIMPVIKDAKIPLIIATSAGQDFVDASGIGGNDYAFKTIPSEVDISRGLVRWMSAQGTKSIALVADEGNFQHASFVAIDDAAKSANVNVVMRETIPKDTKDFAGLFDKLKAANPDRVVAVLGPSSASFFKAYESAKWRVPITGRFDVTVALNAVTPAFRNDGGLAGLTSVAVFSPASDKPEIRDFVSTYKTHYGLVPTQRAFFVYEATYLVVDAIRRAGSDRAADIQKALKTTVMPSRLGGNYAPDEHNHAHTPLQIVYLKGDQMVVSAIE